DAPVIYRALVKGADVVRATADPGAAEAVMRGEFAIVPALTVEYATACDPHDFGPPRTGRPVLLAIAARLGRTRLIDNFLLNDEET
ncbi:MAG TPA: pantoate--beta-alanine ligase, partial [Actinomycetota bacterium]|nr:pantoate--beta-alanine ligase [Actinomycetota bacterium]